MLLLFNENYSHSNVDKKCRKVFFSLFLSFYIMHVHTHTIKYSGCHEMFVKMTTNAENSLQLQKKKSGERVNKLN